MNNQVFERAQIHGVGLGVTLLALVGCSSGTTHLPPPPQHTPRPPARIAAPSPRMPDAPRALPTPSPPALEAPGSPGCVFPADWQLSLRLRADAQPFAEMTGDSSNTTLDLTTAGAKAGAMARMRRDDGFTLEGIVTQKEVALAPTHAMVLAGFYIPEPRARLSWVGTTAGHITVALRPDHELEILPAAHAGAVDLACSDVVSCADVANAYHDFHWRPDMGTVEFDIDRSSVAPTTPLKAEHAELSTDGPVGLSLTPLGPVIAKLRLQEESAGVTVIERRLGHVRILREESHARIFGWVPSWNVHSSVGDQIGDPFEDRGHESGACGVGEDFVRRTFHGDYALPLVAGMGAERRTVGSIPAHQQVALFDDGGEVIHVVLPPFAEEANCEVFGVLRSHLGPDD